MKCFCLLIISALCSTQTLFAQKLKENKVDEFTKNSVKRTSWETLTTNMQFTAQYRLSQINKDKLFDFKIIQGGKVLGMKKGEEMMLKLENGEIVTLTSLESATSCVGCGSTNIVGSAAQGISVTYSLSDEAYSKLTGNKVDKVRIYTTDGYLEKEVKDKAANTLQTTLSLIQ